MNYKNMSVQLNKEESTETKHIWKNRMIMKYPAGVIYYSKWNNNLYEAA